MGPLLLPSHLYTILHCTAWFSLPVFFNHIHKVSICLFSDVFEPQRKESGLIQTHSTPSSFLLQHFIKRGLTIAELFFLWRTQKSILSLRTVSSWSLNDRKQNIWGTSVVEKADRRDFMEQKLKEVLPSTNWTFTWSCQRPNSTCLEVIHIFCKCMPIQVLSFCFLRTKFPRSRKPSTFSCTWWRPTTSPNFIHAS